MAQAVHAAVTLALAHPARTVATPNTVVLSVSDATELVDWGRRLGSGAVVFHEPDLGGEATALATFADGRRFANLPLAGRVVVMA